MKVIWPELNDLVLEERFLGQVKGRKAATGLGIRGPKPRCR